MQPTEIHKEVQVFTEFVNSLLLLSLNNWYDIDSCQMLTKPIWDLLQAKISSSSYLDKIFNFVLHGVTLPQFSQALH